MALKSFIESVVRLIKTMGRPSREEVWASIKISLIGVTVLGVFGFLIKFLGAIFLQAVAST